MPWRAGCRKCVGLAFRAISAASSYQYAVLCFVDLRQIRLELTPENWALIRRLLVLFRGPGCAPCATKALLHLAPGFANKGKQLVTTCST